MSEHAIKVGDQLAVPRRFCDGWDIYTVRKITPAGLIKISYGDTQSDTMGFTLNPDLTLRGDLQRRCAEPLNDEIRESTHRDEVMMMIGRYDLAELPTATLKTVLKTLRGENVMTFDDLREKPKGDEIRVSLDSGANIHSRHDAIVSPQDLGFDSKAKWDAASDDDKLKAVQDYFYGNGYPEWSWDDEESASE